MLKCKHLLQRAMKTSMSRRLAKLIFLKERKLYIWPGFMLYKPGALDLEEFIQRAVSSAMGSRFE